MNHLHRIVIFFIISLMIGAGASDAQLPSAGVILPDLRFETLSSESDREYLGIGDSDTFGLDDIRGRVIVLEVVGVYCPQCLIQNPKFNQLFQRINRNKTLREKVKMIAVAAGATPKETEFWIKQTKTQFPVIPDTKFELHKLLGEPRTPFTMLITEGRKTAYAHLGAIENIDDFFLRIQKLAQ